MAVETREGKRSQAGLCQCVAVCSNWTGLGAFTSAHDWPALISPCGVCICTNCRRLKLHMQCRITAPTHSRFTTCCAKARAPPRADLLAVAALCSRTGGIGRCSASASPIEATPASSRASGVAITKPSAMPRAPRRVGDVSPWQGRRMCRIGQGVPNQKAVGAQAQHAACCTIDACCTIHRNQSCAL